MNAYVALFLVWTLPGLLITAWILADRWLDQRADDQLDLPVDDVWGDYYSTVAAHERDNR